MADLTGNKIKDTYTGLLQIEGDVIQDGTGSITNLPFNQLSGTPTLVSSSNQIASDISGSFTLVSSSFSTTITDIIDGTITVTSASYAVSSSHEITYELSCSHAVTADQVSFTGVQNKPTLISSSVQIASDISGSITEFSSSISSRVSTSETNITALQSFSSSLDATFATDLELSNVSSSFATTIDNIQHTDITLLNNFTSSIQSEVDSLNAASSSFLTGIGDGIISSSKQISDFGFISSSHTDIAALNNFSSSIQTQVDGLVAATGSYITTLSAQTLNELSDVNDYTSSAIIDGYRLAWDSGSQEWAPAPSNTLKGTTRLFISTVRSNSSSFFFNSITRTATDSASPVADSAFLLTSALLNKVTIYLRNDAASANTCTVEVFKNSNGIDFGLASSLASDVQTLTTDTTQTFTFTGLTLAQFDSLHFKVTPTIAGGQYYGIVIIE